LIEEILDARKGIFILDCFLHLDLYSPVTTQDFVKFWEFFFSLLYCLR
jgi:hypothetical protein